MNNEQQFDDLKQRVFERTQREYSRISTVDPAKVVEDVFSFDRIKEQVDRLEKDIGPLMNRRVLEIGSGYGQFLVEAFTRSADVYGVEPSLEGFYGETYDITQAVLERSGVPVDRIINAFAEKLPFPDQSFDVVYSSNVLEHVADPEAVIRESVRVLKPGGYLHMTVPNYGSFWEGHYVLFWMPYMPKWLARGYVRFWGRDPSFIDSLQFITVPWLQRILREHQDILEVRSMGANIFRERMQSVCAGHWAGLQKIQGWLDRLNRWGMLNFVTGFAILINAQTPIVCIAQKRLVSGNDI